MPKGARLNSRTLLAERSVERYLEANARPRWMERIMEIERGLARLQRELAHAHGVLSAECADDRKDFARRWRGYVETLDLEPLNETIRVHNEWYPVERDLPVDPRTGRYRVKYRRPEVDAAWVLERFPAA